ncbi:MAG: sugar transporter [Bacteroidota bacterium]|nr:sugar transporter [Bacteroidota bacterium]
MKKFFLTLLGLCVLTITFGQILNPVRFSYAAQKKGVNEYVLHIRTYVDPSWHIYSIYNPDGGAQATVLNFKKVKPVGKAREEGKMKVVFEKEFNVNQKYFENNVDFMQTVRVTPGTKAVAGTIEYMVCNDRQCLPPKTIAFNIAL